MKRIRNVRKAWLRLGDLIDQHAEAVRRHGPRLDLQMEMQSVRQSIIDYELRQERKAYGAGTTRSGSSRLGFQKDGLRPGAGVQTSYSFRSRPSA